MNALNIMHTTTCNCAACAPVPTLGIKMPYEEEKKELVKTRKGRQKLVVGENDLATVAPKVAAMLSEKDKHFAFEVTAGSKRKLVFVCPNCGQEFEATIQNVVRSVNHNLTGCPVCAGKKIVPGVNDLASKYPEIAAMWSGKNKLSASEVAVKSNKKVFFKCRDCGKEFETKIEHVVYAVENGTTGCPVCNRRKVVPGINDLASRYPKVAAMWSNKNEKSALEVTAKTDKKAIFKCPDCGKEFKAQIGSVVDSVNNGFTGCYDCMMRRVNAISKPEWFYTRPMLAFAGENGIANPFFDVRNILGENSLLGLDFVDHMGSDAVLLTKRSTAPNEVEHVLNGAIEMFNALKEHGVHDVVIYTDARVAQYMSENASRLLNGRSEVCRRYIDMAWNTMTSVSVRFVTSPVKSEYAQLTASTVNCFIKPRV